MNSELTHPSAGSLTVPEVTVTSETATHMAEVFQQATARLKDLFLEIDAEQARLKEVFASDNYDFMLRISHTYSGSHYEPKEAVNPILDIFKRSAWKAIVEKLSLKNVMSIKRRKEFEEQLESGQLPEINPENITSIILGLAGQAQDFARDAAREVFDLLRPPRSKYKTNDIFMVGRRVILAYYVEQGYKSRHFRVNHYHDQHVTALDGVFHLLDGKGVMRENRGPLHQAILDAEGGVGQTEYFKFKFYKNHNLHLEFKRLDLVKELNGLAAGEYVLGADDE